MKLACSLVVCLAGAWAATASEEKPTTRVYTNEDLERMRPRRGETGATSQAALEPAGAAPRGRERPAGRGEQFWRREAERERRRLEPLRQRLLGLEHRLAEQRAKPKQRRPSGEQLHEPLAAQIEGLRARIREAEGRFEDRARREGALPGWLR